MAALVPGQLPNLLSSLLPFPHHPQNTGSSTRSAGLPTSETIILTSHTSSVIGLISPSQAPSTATTSAPESSVTPSLSSLAISSSSISETSSITLTPTPAPIESTSDGSTFYLTITSSAFPSPSIQAAPTNTSNGFLQNKVLSGIVFAVVGVVILVLVMAIAIIALRRSRRKRLHDEAVNFDPTFLKSRDSLEKRRFSILSSDNGHSGRGREFSTAATTHARQDPCHYPGSESQHTMITHSQRQWPRATAHVPQSELPPVWAYVKDADPLPHSSTHLAR